MNIQANRNHAEVTPQALLSFFLPLAASSMMMMASHSIVSSAMARTASAAAALAAYSVAQSVSVLFESPCYNIRRMAVALFDDKMSYDSVRKVSLGILAVVSSIMLLIAFGPLGRPVFIGMVGIKESLYPEAISVFRVFLILPTLSILRSFYQGLIIVKRRTVIMTMNMMIRLALMLGLAWLLPKAEFLSGGVVGGIILVIGIGTEGVLAMLAARTWRSTLPDEPADGKPPIQPVGALWFYLPLAFAAFFETFGRPIINAGLARTATPELALAGYQIAYSFSWIFVAIAFNIHQIVIVFVKDSATYRKVRTFVWLIGLCTTSALLLLTISGGTHWLMANVIGVEQDIITPAVHNVLVLAFMPMALSISELYAGLLISGRQTPGITIAKVTNLVGIAAATFIVSTQFPQLAQYMAGISMLTGVLFEGITAFIIAHRTIFRTSENTILAKQTAAS